MGKETRTGVSPNPFVQQLIKHGPVVTDGAWGTQFQLRGLAMGECPDAWNLSHPGIVEDVARAYVEAGSQIILTNTFRANRVALGHYGLARKAAEISRVGVEISRRAAAGSAYVFGSIGPTGKLLLTNEISEEEVRAAFVEQAQALAEGGADGILIETMADLNEARVALGAAKTTKLPVVVSMVFDSGKNKDRTIMGTTPQQAAKELAAIGADVVGANCGEGMASYVSICAGLRAGSERPIWIKPSAGVPEIIKGRPVYGTTPEQFATQLTALVEAGASFIGGCCGTGPEFIRALKRHTLHAADRATIIAGTQGGQH